MLFTIPEVLPIPIPGLSTVGADEPRADRLLELYTTAFARPKTDSQATRIAELLVGPALLLGLAALGRGGIHMTKAVIRPDYFSGPDWTLAVRPPPRKPSSRATRLWPERRLFR